ncbi:MAG: sigma-70 family RNA polymerase sigma factor [Patescibacteria group bacterium]|nr:sigma-70 family RNA polymerase sigma factor [Patescibacteria group bacterium]MDE2057643.1 sigma-70 family RNA polymerase sigma factor [Patescibacteria group bacterium]
MESSREDAELIAAYLAGDEAAFEALAERHLRGAYTLALRLTGEREMAEDVVQEAFVKAWRALGRYARAEASFKTWLARIVRNTAIDHLRKKRHVPFSAFEGDEGEPAAPEIASDEPLPDELAARAEGAAAVERAVATLPLPYREALALHYGDGLTFDEMAEVTGTSANTLKSRHRRALAALRAVLHPPAG